MITPNQIAALCARRIVSCRELEHFRSVFATTLEKPLVLESCDKRVAGATEDGVMLELWVWPDLTVSRNYKTGSWTAWQPRALFDREQSILQWGDFGAGEWTEEVPTVAGLYATRDLQGCRGRDRRMELVEGTVRDITTFCPAHKLTEWEGDWWNRPYPRLPGSL